MNKELWTRRRLRSGLERRWRAPWMGRTLERNSQSTIASPRIVWFSRPSFFLPLIWFCFSLIYLCSLHAILCMNILLQILHIFVNVTTRYEDASTFVIPMNFSAKGVSFISDKHKWGLHTRTFSPRPTMSAQQGLGALPLIPEFISIANVTHRWFGVGYCQVLWECN